jgi:hypothetical protein
VVRVRGRSEIAVKVRTLWALFAMIPLVVLAVSIGVLSVLICTPLMVYAGIRGKHLKDPFKGSLGPRR